MGIRDALLASLVAILWGGNFIAAKYSVSYFPPFFFTALRFIITAAVLLPFVARPNVTQMKNIAAVSTLASLHFSLVFAALYHGLDIASSSLIGQLGVPFSCLLGAIFFNDKMGFWRISGIVVAFVGVGIITGTPNVLTHPLAFLLVLGSTLTWGGANILVKRVQHVGHMQMLAWVSLLNIPWLLIISSLVEGNALPLLMRAPIDSLLGLAYTVVLSTLVAYGIWYYLLGKHPVSQVTPFSLMVPVFAILFGHLFFYEGISWQVIVGGIVTIAGVAIIVARRPKLLVHGEAV